MNRSYRKAAPKFAFQFSDVKPGAVLTEGPNVIDPITLTVERVEHDSKNDLWHAYGKLAGGQNGRLTYWVCNMGRARTSYPMPGVMLAK